MQGFPGGSVDKNPPANAGDISLIPGPGRSHMPWATKPMHHNSWARKQQLESSPAARESPSTAAKTSAAKSKSK